jgi:hypothetical protein
MTQLITFHRFFVFNSKFQGKREEDDYLKLLTFFPQELTLNQKMRCIGLAEAIASFTTYERNNHNFTIRLELFQMKMNNANLFCVITKDMYFYKLNQGTGPCSQSI